MSFLCAYYADSAESISVTEELRVAPEWEIPVPLRSYTLPEFPVEILPDWLADFVCAEAVTTQTPKDLAGMLSLASCATALAGRFKVQVKPGWYEPLNLYVAVALPSGNRKSSVFRDVTLPIRDHESILREILAGEIAEENTKLDLVEERLKQAKANASKTDDPAERTKLEDEAAQLAYELSFTKRLNIPRFLADDVSPEKLSNLLYEQDGRLSIMSAEGTVFDLITGRYSKGVPNLDVYLNAHPGDTIRVDRIGRQSEFIENPALTIGVTVQPDVLKRLADKPELRGRGLLARFLYSLPESTVGMRDPDPPAMPDFVRDRYCDNLHRLIVAGRQDGWKEPPEPYTLVMSPEARTEMTELARRIEPRLGDFGSLESLKDWGSKLAGEVARIAGILHLAEHVIGEDAWIMEVSAESVRRAITLGEHYLIDHAVAAHALMGADSKLEDALYILKWIRQNGISIASKRDIFNELRGRFDRADHVEPGIRILITHGYLREAQGERRAGPGRPPSPKYEVNPFVHSHNPQIEQNRNEVSAFELTELGLSRGVSLN
jgi:replicative DNA helicase